MYVVVCTVRPSLKKNVGMTAPSIELTMTRRTITMAGSFADMTTDISRTAELNKNSFLVHQMIMAEVTFIRENIS